MEEPPERYLRERHELQTALKRLRLGSGLTGILAAERAGMSQPKISRIENGATVPSPDEVEVLCRLYGASAEETDKLSDLSGSLHRHVESARTIMRGGAWRKQRQIAGVQAQAHRISVYQPVMVPGLLQSRAYAREIYALTLSGEHLERSLTALYERQEVLDDKTKRLAIIMSEAALRWRVCDDDVMADQIRHLIDLAGRPYLRIGIIPFSARVREVPLNGFTLYDDRLVTVGTETVTLTLNARDDIERYQFLLGLLEEAAEFDAVVPLLAEVEAAYR